MTSPLVRRDEADDASSEPTAQILWLHGGRLVDAPPPSPVPLLRTPPPGWYGDRLRYFDGADWTDEIRPIRRPSSLMRVAYEEAPSADAETGPRTLVPSEASIPVPCEVGLLGMPPSLPREESTSSWRSDPEDRGPSEVGLLAMPPARPSRKSRRAPWASDVRHGIVAGLRTSRFVLLWAAGAVALVVVVGLLSNI